MKLLDLSKFEKIAEDKHTATMKHKDGHTMSILIKALPRIHQEQLKRLPLAKGGKVHKYADGGETDNSSDSTLTDNAGNPPQRQDGGGRSDQEIIADQNAALSNRSPASDSSSSDDSAPDHSTTININAAPTPPAATPAAQPAPIAGTTPVSAAATMAQQPVNPAVPTVPQALPNVNATSGTMNPGAVMKNAQTANQSQADIDSAKGQGMSGIEQGYIENTQELAQTGQQNLADWNKHTADFADYIKANPINENAYLDNASTGKKITNALGLFLGGLGGGINGTGGNVAMDFINKQIDRNIQGQKDRMDQQKTIYGAYHQLYGDSLAANNATKASMLDIYAHQANLLAAKLATPQAQQRAMQFNAQAALEKSKLAQESAVNMRSLPGYSGSGGGSAQAAPQATGGTSAVSGSKSQNNSNPDGILVPNADKIFKNLQYTPKARDMIPAIANQYNQAVQADKSLKDLDDVYSTLEKDVDEGSIGGNIRRRGGAALDSIPLIGGIGSGLIRYATDTPANTGYEAKQSELIGKISSALKGTNIGGDQIQHIVSANSPERGDTPELKAQKKQAIKDFIKNHTETSLLSTWGLTK